MNRIDRLTAILIQLQTRRVTTGREIADRFGIKSTTSDSSKKNLQETAESRCSF